MPWQMRTVVFVSSFLAAVTLAVVAKRTAKPVSAVPWNLCSVAGWKLALTAPALAAVVMAAVNVTFYARMLRDVLNSTAAQAVSGGGLFLSLCADIAWLLVAVKHRQWNVAALSGVLAVLVAITMVSVVKMHHNAAPVTSAVV